MKKNRKNNKNNSGKLTKLKFSLIKSKDPAVTFATIRNNIAANNIDQLIEWISTSKTLQDKTIGTKYPATVKDWGSTYVPFATKKNNEFDWAFSIIKCHIDSINSFIDISNQFQVNFLLEDYEKCSRLLDSLENQYGISLWLIEKRLILLQYSKGLDAQKKYAEQLINNEFVFNRIPFLIHYISHRTEPSTSPERFNKYFDNYLKQLDITENLDSYLRFHILHQDINNTSAIYDILRYDLNTSIFDYYETYLICAQFILEISEPSAVSAIKKNLVFLSYQIDDTRIEALATYYCGKISNTLNPSPFHLRNFDLYTTGERDAAFYNAIDQLTNNPVDLGSIYLVALTGNRDILNQFLKYNDIVPAYVMSLIEIFSNKMLGDQWISLKQYAWAFRGTAFGMMMNAFINREYDYHPLSKQSNIYCYNFIFFDKFNPIFLLWFDTEEERVCYNSIFERNISRETYRNFVDHINNISHIQQHEDTSNWIQVKEMISTKNYSSALILVEKLSESSDYYKKRYASKTKIHSLLKLNLHEECIVEIINQFLFQDANINLLPIKNVYQSLDSFTRNNIQSRIEFAILSSLYVTNIEPNKQYLRSDACEDFILSQNIQKPSQLATISSTIDHEKLIYFLKNICTEATMDTWMQFSSSQEVARERVEICRLIIDLDPNEKEICQSEIREIMQKIKIKERLREIDQSKIYVDIESVKKAAQNDLKDNFLRYTSFLASGMSHEDVNIREKASKALANKEYDEILSLEFPRHEMSTLFESMVIRLRDEFVSSNQHGLDGYLSVRIRHNTLAGQLWIPFENEHLLVYKNSNDDGYKPNEYWITELGIEYSPQDCNILENALIKFKEEYDQLVCKLRNNWIQVKKTNEAAGLIDFRLLDKEVGYLSTWIKKDTTLDYFIDEIIKYFFTAKLEPGLKTLRTRLQNEIKPKVHLMLVELQASCENINVDTSRLRTAIGRARTNAQITLDRITEWFRLSFIEKLQPFAIDEVISISEASIKTACPEFTSIYNPSKEMEQLVIKGNLTSFVDVLFIAFDNIVQHSGHSGYPVANIYSDYSDNTIIIRIENPIYREIPNIDDLKIRIENKKHEVIRKPFSEYVTQESGTGFYKMHKILHHDFSSIDKLRKPLLDFGFKNDSTFFVQVSIPILSVHSMEDFL